jgi:thymidylate synthase (FAD)
MSNVSVVWATADAENLIAYMARVSNPENQDNPEYEKLIRYLIKHKHWSPFEMVNVCMSISCTRDIARQILRHRSFTFQEFSQRYAVAQDYEVSDARMQDKENRQNSIVSTDLELNRWWDEQQKKVISSVSKLYDHALQTGIAKEVARKVLPEGLTMSRMYVNGTLRSWMHYTQLRCGVDTQVEHRQIALEVHKNLSTLFPTVMGALEEEA